MIAPRTVTVDDSVVEIFDSGSGSGPTICAAHPAETTAAAHGTRKGSSSCAAYSVG